MTDCNIFWLKNPIILIKCWRQLWPFDSSLTKNEQYNSLTRLVIIIFISLALYQKNMKYLLIGFISIIIIIIAYKFIGGTYSQTLLNQNPNTYIGKEAQIRQYPETTTLNDGNQDCSPYGNPNPYQHCTAVNQEPLRCNDTCIVGDQFIDKLYNNSSKTPPGLLFNRVPDTTWMSRRPYPLTGYDAVTNTGVGNTDNVGTPTMRY